MHHACMAKQSSFLRICSEIPFFQIELLIALERTIHVQFLFVLYFDTCFIQLEHHQQKPFKSDVTKDILLIITVAAVTQARTIHVQALPSQTYFTISFACL